MSRLRPDELEASSRAMIAFEWVFNEYCEAWKEKVVGCGWSAAVVKCHGDIGAKKHHHR